MKKFKNKQTAASRTSYKALKLVAAGLVVLLILGYLFRGWVRMSVIPRAVTVVYGNPAQRVFESETKKLGDPLAVLGYKSLEGSSQGCHTSLANGASTQVYCVYDVRAFSEIKNLAVSSDSLNENAEKLQKLLQQNGWQGEYSDNGQYMSLKKLVSSITAGIDYQPDATYEKHIGEVVCYFHANTAFASPNPPALATQISCLRPFNVLGTPEWQ